MKPEMADDVPTALAKVHKAAGDGRNFRLILADAVLPGIDGFTLAEWLQQRRQAGRPGDPHALGIGAPQPAKTLPGPRRVVPGEAHFPVRLVQPGRRGVGHPAAGRPRLPIQPRPPFPPAPSRLLRLLLAEDTPANQKLVTYVLGKRGHSVEVVQNGQQALEAVGRQDFDAVLMDVQMPVMDGFQATQAIRKLADPKKARLPIIAMTAHALKGDAERCLAAGMDGYISKPVKGEELIELVERLVGEPLVHLRLKTAALNAEKPAVH